MAKEEYQRDPKEGFEAPAESSRGGSSGSGRTKTVMKGTRKNTIEDLGCFRPYGFKPYGLKAKRQRKLRV